MKKIAIAMSMIFCLAAFANAQRPWSATSVPGKAGVSCPFYKAGKPGDRKHFRRDGKFFERQNYKKFQKPGFRQNGNFYR